MKEYEQEDPIPQGDLALQLTALPRETNGFGDIFGGWLVSQMDLAGTAMASRVAAGRVATVSIDRMAFMVPVAVGPECRAGVSGRRRGPVRSQAGRQELLPARPVTR